MSESDFIRLWDERLADWCSARLMKHGVEGALLAGLADYPVAASRLVKHAAASDDYTRRKLAGVIAGYCRGLSPNTLDEIFEAEAARNRRVSDMMQRLECQSVVEDVVFAATRWCRPTSSGGSLGRVVAPCPPNDAHAREAIAVLTKIVERTVGGEYWNTASYAMTTLCRCHAPKADELLGRFYAFAHGDPPKHPSNPSLTQERGFADGLMAKRKATLDAIENLLLDKDEAANAVRLDAEAMKLIKEWLDAARSVT